MIWLNFLRDLRRTAPRLISVTIITAIAVLVYTALAGISYNIDRISWGYFDSQNVADYWITGVGLDQGDCRTLLSMPQVTGVQPRNVYEAQDKDNEAVKIQLYAVADYTVNTPFLLEGQLPADSRQMLVSDEFAREQGIAVGDWYEMTIPGTDLLLRLQVCGLVKSPECIHHISATTPTPDYSRYGYAYLDDEVLSALAGENTYNQICLTVQTGADDGALRQAIWNALGSKVVNVLALEDNTQVYTLVESKDSIAVILNVFPVLFFLCAVLMMVSTMNRIVEGARTTVGTFKALGYSDRLILCYYLLHALLVVAVGFVLGNWVSPPITRLLVSSFAAGCDLLPYTIQRDRAAAVQALAITAACCLGSAWLVCRSLLRESPAQCMRPKPPAKVRPVLLERIGPVWRRLGFNQKYIARNTLRNKARMFTCVIGIAFCMGLVLLAFALKDSLDHYGNSMAENQYRYDLVVDLDSGVSEGQYTRLQAEPLVEEAEFEMSTACWLYTSSRRTTSTLCVCQDQVDLKQYDPYAQGISTLPQDGIVLEEALAEELGVEEGDMVTLHFTGDWRYYTVRVAEVNRCVSGVYMGRGCWRGLGLAFTPTAAYLKTADIAALEARLNRYDFVNSVQTRQTVTAAAVDRLDSASTVVYILIVFGGALACVVIYNLGIMSFYEQIRSLATLMVLGFYPREIKRLQLSENILFALAGVCLGIPIGIVLNQMMIDAISTMPLEQATRPVSYLLSCGITMAFALLVNGLIGRKMGEIDMLGALKSVE